MVEDVYQLTTCQLLAGKEIANTFYYVEDPASSQDNPRLVAEEIGREFFLRVYKPFWQPIISADMRFVAVFGFRIWPELGDPATSVYGGEAGLVAGDSVPNGSAVLFSGTSITRNRNFQRRFYIAGLPEVHSEQSAVTAPQREQWQAFANGIRDTVLQPTGLAPGLWTPCSFSKLLSAEAGTTPYSPLSQVRLNPYVRSQRGRNVRKS